MQFFYWLIFLMVISIGVFAVQNSNAPAVVIKVFLWRFEAFADLYPPWDPSAVGILITLFFWIPRAVKTSIRSKELKKEIKNLETVLRKPASLGQEGNRGQRVMKKAIIIPIYLKFDQPEELPHLEGLRLAKRAIESLKILEDQDFTLILPVCFDLVVKMKRIPLQRWTGFSERK